MTLHRILVLIAVVLLFMWYNREDFSDYGPGVVAPNDPVQVLLDEPIVTKFDGYTMSQLASFDIEARVLGRENYQYDGTAHISPMDLAMGWGRMSDEAVLADIDISQSGRFYFWRVKSYPIPHKEIQTHSSNMHMIPANDHVADILKEVREGDIVSLSGSLVEVMFDDGGVWRSSLTREDSGNGACEIILVKFADIVNR